MCTQIFAPVCAELDTGIRCVKAPCPSSEPRQFPNACEACKDAKVRGYWPRECEAVGQDAAAVR
jgi:hypothetical protein